MPERVLKVSAEHCHSIESKSKICKRQSNDLKSTKVGGDIRTPAKPIIAGVLDGFNFRVGRQNTSARKPATHRTVLAMRDSVFKGKWPQFRPAIGRTAE